MTASSEEASRSAVSLLVRELTWGAWGGLPSELLLPFGGRQGLPPQLRATPPSASAPSHPKSHVRGLNGGVWRRTRLWPPMLCVCYVCVRVLFVWCVCVLCVCVPGKGWRLSSDPPKDTTPPPADARPPSRSFTFLVGFPVSSSGKETRGMSAPTRAPGQLAEPKTQKGTNSRARRNRSRCGRGSRPAGEDGGGPRLLSSGRRVCKAGHEEFRTTRPFQCGFRYISTCSLSRGLASPLAPGRERARGTCAQRKPWGLRPPQWALPGRNIAHTR